MAAPRVSHCIFCDDVRFEVGNKFSFIGVFGPDIGIPIKFPAILPKLAIVVWTLTDPDDIPDSIQVTVILPDGNEVLKIGSSINRNIENLEGAAKIVTTQIIPISPMPLPCSGMLEVWIETDQGRMRAGRIRVHSTSTNNEIEKKEASSK